jgi:uncharacterized protein with HEPN domain
VKRDYRDYIQDMLEAIDESTEFTKDMSFDIFVLDRRTVNAVVRSLEVMGEAATRIPEHLRSRAPRVPWKYMAAMRNKLIHEYFGVDLSIVWTVIKSELPPLRAEIEALLTDLDSE